MKILGLQIDSSQEESPEARLQRVLEFLRDSNWDTELIILPEHWISGAFNLLYDISLMTNLYKVFLDEAQLIVNQRGVYIHTGSGLYPDKYKKLHNTSFIITPGDQENVFYNKIHPFKQEFGEITEGENLLSLNILDATISPLICYDLRFPESFRGRQNFGNEVYIVSAAWPQTRIETWKHLLKTRAIENQAYVIGINGVGQQQIEILGGNSTIFGPTGKLLAFAGATEESLSFDIDLFDLRQHRATNSFLIDAKISHKNNPLLPGWECNCGNDLE